MRSATRVKGKTVNDSFAEELQGAREGDVDALSRLLLRFGPQVRASLSIQAHWRDAIDPDDIMQVTYTDAFLRIGSCAARHEGAFRTWLAQIARNNLIDAIRGLEAEKRPPVHRRILPGDNGDPYIHLCELAGATTSTPSRVVAREELRSAVNQALRRLPPDYETVIRELDLEGRSLPEVAETLGRSRAAVHMLAGRARERLRELLEGGTRFFLR